MGEKELKAYIRRAEKQLNSPWCQAFWDASVLGGYQLALQDLTKFVETGIKPEFIGRTK